jgi:hypothetical protein
MLSTLFSTIFLTVFSQKRAIAVLLVMSASCFLAYAEERVSWQHVPTDEQLTRLPTLPAVSKTKIYEVVPTKIETAQARHLAGAVLAVLTCADADFLTGGHYSCEENNKPILLRAVYANGGTGNFTVRYDDSGALYVHHGSLGDLESVRNLPLIVNLPFVPASLFAWASSAR